MQQNAEVLFDILKQRHSTRNFSNQIIDREDIKKITEAARLAPFGDATGFTREECRKIFVIAPDAKNRAIIITELRKVMKKNARVLGFLSLFSSKFKSFHKRVKNFADNGIPALTKNTYWILIAEKKGFPPVAKQSMAHALQNMWLAATAMGYGFQMLSASTMLTKSPTVMHIFNIYAGEYEIDGCVVGIKVRT
ncbi:MAG: nitroreductase family protein [Rickettsiales bacterium]|jgi:nitroreductase|nr:nitroreductase family protein [Rickettsiales bacterium]